MKMLVSGSVRTRGFSICSVIGMGKGFPKMPLNRRRGIANAMLDKLRDAVSAINEPGRFDEVNCIGFGGFGRGLKNMTNIS